MIKVEAGNILQIDKFVRIKVFNPGKILTNDINDNSIVMKLEYNSFSCLFTGDISKIIENDLVKKYGKELQSDLLKVAHHGSKTSSDESFIKIVKPQIALIGVGVNNKFGHPNNEILESLIDIKCNIYRTDKDGEINLRVDNRR